MKTNARARQVGGNHYKEMPIQPWDAMESWMTPEEWRGFLRGNVIKYIARAGSKGDAAEDLHKAQHYLERLLEAMDDDEEDPCDRL